jgi:hypothetical protein
MGEVYLAQDKRLGLHVAPKFLPAFFQDRGARLLTEARAAASLHSPILLRSTTSASMKVVRLSFGVGGGLEIWLSNGHSPGRLETRPSQPRAKGV